MPRIYLAGAAITTAGVLLQIPDVIQLGRMHEKMHGGSMHMAIGMTLAGAGVLVGALGLVRSIASEPDDARPVAPEIDHGGFTPVYWLTCGVMTVALVIDIMKPLTIGFVLPGMGQEYGLPLSTTVALPLVALTGTVVGSIVWGLVGDRYGRRPAFLLATLLFVGTSACGAMPAFWLNLIMCFLMGSSAGGLLPLVFTLLAELTPRHHRGWIAVTVGGLGGVGGYLAASTAAHVLEPDYSWRALWLIGLPTGWLLIAGQVAIPESPQHLLRIGRRDRAEAVLARYGAKIADTGPAPSPMTGLPRRRRLAVLVADYPGITAALGLLGMVWGLVNFGFLLLLPAQLVRRGYGHGTASGMLANATLLAAPGLLAVVLLYGFWSSRRALVLCTMMVALALAGLVTWSVTDGGRVPLIASVGLLVLSLSAVNAMLIPYTAEIYPTALRATGTGVVGATTKIGGVLGPVLTMLSLSQMPSLVPYAVVLAVLVVAVAFLTLVVAPDIRRFRIAPDIAGMTPLTEGEAS